MANAGFIFVSNASKIPNMCLQACTFVKKVLYVKVYDNMRYVTPLALLSQQNLNVYSKAISNYKNLDIRLILDTAKNENIYTSFPVDLVMCDNDLIIKGQNLSKTIRTLNKESKETTLCAYGDVPPISCIDDIQTYPHVVVGGVFDRLHDGHKMLLSEAALRTTQQLTVGITDEILLQNKTLWELIEPIEKRRQTVKDFLNDIKPELSLNVVTVQDTFGPTIHDFNLQMIVVSPETNWGVDKINQYRQEHNLCILDKFVVDLISDATPNKLKKEEAKISSSNERLRSLGSMIKTPLPNHNKPESPYIIGIAGGISCGKTSLACILSGKGAGFIDCNIIERDMFEPDQPLNKTITKLLGDHALVKPNGEIDRKILIQILHDDVTKLNVMKKEVFPVLLEEIERQIQELKSEHGYNIIMVESSLMLPAKWYENCHQLWVVIVPPDEAVARTMDTYYLSEEKAKQLIDKQPSNSDYVSLANVVFSSQWSLEFLRAQAEKAWEELQVYLKNKETEGS